MRFATAIVILAQVHPIVSEISAEQTPSVDIRTPSDVANSGKWHNNDLNSKTILKRAKSKYSKRSIGTSRECDPASNDADIGMLSCQENMYCVPDEQSKMGGYCAQLSTTIMSNDKVEEPILCDPTFTDADIGVLSCGADSICVNHPSSSIGGVCVKTITTDAIARDLAQVSGASDGRAYTYCNTSSPYYGMLSCDCTGFDLDTGVGSFACTYDYCFGVVSECCTDTCADITMTYSSNGKGSHTYETCYTFKSPYVQSFCYGHSVTKKNDSSTCFGSFNGKQCDSCQVQNSTCTKFNCGNAGLEDNFCVENFYPPVLTSCYAECSTCSICPGVSDISALATNQSFISFTNFTCGYVEYLGGLGVWGGSQNATCIDIRSVVEKECCMATQDVVESSEPSASPTTSVPLPVMTANPTDLSTEARGETPILLFPTNPSKPTMPAGTFTPGSEPFPGLPPTWSNFPQSPSSSPIEPSDLTCGIRIQTSKCKELLRAHTGIIPCSCEHKCITFIDDKFEKCDAGTSIAGSGSIVAGCTFEMVDDVPFGCFEWDEALPSASVQSIRFSWHINALLMAIPLLSLIVRA